MTRILACVMVVVGMPLICSAEDIGKSPSLKLTTYVTVDYVQNLVGDGDVRGKAIETLKNLGVTGVYLEVHRGGTVATPEQLREVRDFFRERGFTVAGGIATYPGKDFGVAGNDKLHWYNFQAPETRDALAQVMRQSAPLFDTFMVDDFLCTGDTTEQSNAARGDRDWGTYRRDLMVSVARDVLIGPAKEANPGIKMIIKYPQWYDLFHMFGYDVAREPRMFDGVYVGTETRGSMTQRYGFVQPYEGFVNYRWLAALSGDKIGGAWFDHGDCGDHDFIDQAWQSVAAGARELVFFQFGDLVEGHPDHARLREQYASLAKLAECVRANPVVGPAAYKPPHSDPGDDRYIMDFIGMLGVSLVPSPEFPAKAATVFLPTQAAADPDVAAKVDAARKAGANIIMTPGFLAKAQKGADMAAWAGVDWPVTVQPMRAATARVDGREVPVEHGLDLAADIKPAGAEVLLEAVVDGRPVPFLIARTDGASRVSVLNVRTFSQADFDAVGEVLLAPRQLGLLSMPAKWLDVVRAEFERGSGCHFRAGARVTCQQLGTAGWLIQNYSESPEDAALTFAAAAPSCTDVLTGKTLTVVNDSVEFQIPPRGRVWMQKSK